MGQLRWWWRGRTEGQHWAVLLVLLRWWRWVASGARLRWPVKCRTVRARALPRVTQEEPLNDEVIEGLFLGNSYECMSHRESESERDDVGIMRRM